MCEEGSKFMAHILYLLLWLFMVIIDVIVDVIFPYYPSISPLFCNSRGPESTLLN